MRLLFITPRIDERHDDLAFASLWAKAFADAGYEVTVIAGEVGTHTLSLPVHSVGHEQGGSWLRSFLRFQKLVVSLKYDRVFVHMNTRWLAAGAWYWWMRRIPVYLWFTHYTRTASFRIGEICLKRMFAATKESLPQFEGDPRKIVTGHGIDTKFWDVPELPDAERESATHLLCVHRISRSKRFELVLKALALLPSEYRVTHYGKPQDPSQDPEYAAEIDGLVSSLGLKDRVRFMGAIPMPELRKVYPHYRAFINLVPRTIDKSALEAMYCGLTPVMTRGHSDAIGYPDAPFDDSPEAAALFIKTMTMKPRAELRRIVEEGHSLKRLVEKMSVYIRPGN
ncbi:MAG TPA: glycosyltransferase family 4 protein [Candidatus Methylomirabilis sp.]|nr:glycosyltransferase family 4 protein [Candidatus Methylomirabilis sp.]